VTSKCLKTSAVLSRKAFSMMERLCGGFDKNEKQCRRDRCPLQFIEISLSQGDAK
jgi:hypothetical protein